MFHEREALTVEMKNIAYAGWKGLNLLARDQAP